MAGTRKLAGVAAAAALAAAGIALLLTAGRGSFRKDALRAPAAPPDADEAEARRAGGRVAAAPPVEERTPGEDSRADAPPAAGERSPVPDALPRVLDAVIRDSDGGLEIFRRWSEYGADVVPIVAGYRTMKERIRTGDGPVHRFDAGNDVTPLKLDELTDAAAVIELGVGRFSLDTGGRQWDAIGKVTRSLEIRGAGMVRTTLVAKGWAFVFVGERLENLFVHDLALDFADKTQPFNIRGRAALALENVRVTDWPLAGHAAPLGISGGAFLACRGCDFAGRGGGFVLSLRGPALATFDRCRFADVEATFIGGGAASGGRPSVVRVRECTFENTPLADSRLGNGRRGDGTPGGGPSAGEWAGAVDLCVEGGRVAAGTTRWTDSERRSWWGAGYARRVDGVTFGPGRARFTVDDLLLALDLAERERIAPVFLVEAGSGTRSTGIEIDLYSFDPRSGELGRRTMRLAAGRLEDGPEDPGRGMAGHVIRSADDLEGLLTMAEAVRGSGVPGDEPVTRAEIGHEVTMGEKKTRILVLSSPGLRAIIIDARAGRLLRNR